MGTAAPSTNPNKPATGAYDVARAGGKCAVTGRVIEPGEAYMAALRETPIGFERVDVAMEAWEQFPRADLIGFWRTIMPKGEVKKKLFVDDEVLCNLFERLADTTEPNKLSFRFVLGLILMRKRLIVYESSRIEDTRDLWTVRFKGKEEKMDLLNPKLDEQQVNDVSKQLGEILNEEL